METNLSFFQKSLKITMLFLGTAVDEKWRKFEKFIDITLIFFFAAIVFPSIGFLLTSDDIENNLQSLLFTGSIFIVFYFSWNFRLESHHCLQIYHKLMDSEWTSSVFLKICVEKQKNNIIVSLAFFLIFFGGLLVVVILNLSLSQFTYGSPLSFLYPIKYPWPMDKVGWYYFSLIFHTLSCVPVSCSIIAIEILMLFLRTILQTHLFLIVNKVKNLDNMANGRREMCLGTGEMCSDEVILELRDIIRYHQFFMGFTKHVVKVSEISMNFAALYFIWIYVLALASMVMISNNLLFNMRAVVTIFFATGLFSFSCFYANELNEMNESIRVALYDTPWYEQNFEYLRNFMMFQNNCSRPVQIKALGLYVVKLDFVTKVLNRVYSIVQVLIKTIK